MSKNWIPVFPAAAEPLVRGPKKKKGAIQDTNLKF